MKTTHVQNCTDALTLQVISAGSGQTVLTVPPRGSGDFPADSGDTYNYTLVLGDSTYVNELDYPGASLKGHVAVYGSLTSMGVDTWDDVPFADFGFTMPAWAAGPEAWAFLSGFFLISTVRIVKAGLRWFKRVGTERHD